MSKQVPPKKDWKKIAEGDEPHKEMVEGDETEIALANMQTQLNDAEEKALRALAEVDNIRRRSIRDVEKAHHYALEKFANELLPVLDNLERSLALTRADDAATGALHEGLSLTLKSFLDACAKHGIQPVEAQDKPFNPEHHEAMSTVEQPDTASGTVVTVIQKGYLLHDRLIRPARVIIAK